MDSWRDVSIWKSLALNDAETGSLLASIDAERTASPALIARLRRQHAAPTVSAAIELMHARRKAIGKLDFAPQCYADLEGVEMASSSRGALWKAERFAAASLRELPLLDLCTGVGADLHAIVERCGAARVLGVELDPLRAWMAATNARCRVREADVASHEVQAMISGALLHCDPPRRDASGRVWKRGSQTTNEFDLGSLLAWMRAARGGALKLGPGVARELVCAPDTECEFIEVDTTMEQCVVWTGALAPQPNSTRATRLGATTHTRVGVPRAVPQAEAIGPYLYEPCAAIERAGLLSDLAVEIDASEIARGLGLLTGAREHASPWAECFEIAGEISRSPTEAISRRCTVGGPEQFRSVRVRGKALDEFGGADRVTKALGCQSNGSLVLHAWRDGAKCACVVTRVV